MKRSPDVAVGATLVIAAGIAGCNGSGALHDLPERGEPGARPAPSAGEAMFLPAYRVIDEGADAERAATLAAALGLAGEAFEGGALVSADGAIRYLDRDRFQRLPTRKAAPPAPGFRDERGRATAEGNDATDFAALKAIRVLPEEDAAAQAWDALEIARLPFGREITSGHTLFEAADAEGREVARALLDTQVTFREGLEGLRLIGPGAKVKVTFDPEGEVSHLIYARRELERAEDVAVVPPSEAPALCAAALGGGEGIGAEPELAYYAPPLDRGVQRILPHYVCSARRTLGGQVMDVRKVIVPAVIDAPRAALAVHVEGASVSAEASVVGGAAPYTYRWVSSTRSFGPARAGAAKVEYTIDEARLRGEDAESLSLYVTDADGLVATASERIVVAPTAAPPEESRPPPGTPPSGGGFGVVGAEWVGLCGGLDHSAANVEGLLDRFKAAGIEPSFNWGDSRAWEIDFKDPVLGGQDAAFADSVDLAFYTGHANGFGLMFCSTMSDRFLHFREAHWGNSNLEWMVVAACGPLQDDDGAWRTRWSTSFNGMHLLLGYATESFDDTTEGAKFASYLLDDARPAPLREAWVKTAIEVQPDDGVIYAVMGVYGPGWTVPNYDDYFWEKGPVGPDVAGSAKIGYWRISGPT
jgi:hypothetical protein